MTPKPKLIPYEKWAEKLVKGANTNFGLEAKDIQWKVRDINDGKVCDWSFEMEKGTMKGSFLFGRTYQNCALSMAMGIALEMHPLRNQVITLLNYAKAVSLPDKERNSIGELLVRGYIWYELTKKVPRNVAMQQILHDWHIKDNIDETYRVYENWKAHQERKPKLVGNKIENNR